MADDTSWLTPAEMRVWRAWLAAVGQSNLSISDGLKRSTGMAVEDYEVLVHLSEADERRLRMSELSKMLHHSQSRLSQRIDRLAKQGLVDREKCPNDRRGTFAVITPAGFDQLAAAAPHHLSDVRAAVIDHIEPDQLDVVAQVLERIAAAGESSVES